MSLSDKKKSYSVPGKKAYLKRLQPFLTCRQLDFPWGGPIASSMHFCKIYLPIHSDELSRWGVDFDIRVASKDVALELCQFSGKKIYVFIVAKLYNYHKIKIKVQVKVVNQNCAQIKLSAVLNSVSNQVGTKLF